MEPQLWSLRIAFGVCLESGAYIISHISLAIRKSSTICVSGLVQRLVNDN